MSLANGGRVTSQEQRPATFRDRLVVALDTVDGLTAYPTAPDQATAGAAWPKWIETTYDGDLCTLARDTYEVVVTLPGAYAKTTVDQGDGFRDVVAFALIPIARVTFAEPIQITFNDRQTMPGLRFRVVLR
jgi:hypothetical protein